MSLPKPAAREQRHRRTIEAEVYERDDGLWDIDACLTDLKSRDLQLPSGKLRPQGLPVHQLRLRLTFDEAFEVIDAHASSEWVPFPGVCDTVAPAYRALIGLNLLQGFRQAVRRVLYGTAGCTHLTELCNVLPTAAVQGVYGEKRRQAGAQSDEVGQTEPDFSLGACNALRFDGPVVAQFFPRWYGHVPRSSAVPAATAHSSNPIQLPSEGITHEDS